MREEILQQWNGVLQHKEASVRSSIKRVAGLGVFEKENDVMRSLSRLPLTGELSPLKCQQDYWSGGQDQKRHERRHSCRCRVDGCPSRLRAAGCYLA